MAEYCFVVLTKPVAGQEVEYNRWYDNQHIPDVLKVPGIVSAQRFRSEEKGSDQYLALYTLDTEDPDALVAELSSRAGTDKMVMSPAMDMSAVSAVIYRARSPKQMA